MVGFPRYVLSADIGAVERASEGGPNKFATRLATRPGQLPVYAMKSTLALPGLEPDLSSSDEGRLVEVAPDVAQVPDSYGRLTTTRSAVEAGLPTLDCSNVANALRDLSEHAKQMGIDPAHPTMEAAAAALGELATYIAQQQSGES